MVRNSHCWFESAKMLRRLPFCTVSWKGGSSPDALVFRVLGQPPRSMSKNEFTLGSAGVPATKIAGQSYALPAKDPVLGSSGRGSASPRLPNTMSRNGIVRVWARSKEICGTVSAGDVFSWVRVPLTVNPCRKTVGLLEENRLRRSSVGIRRLSRKQRS